LNFMYGEKLCDTVIQAFIQVRNLSDDRHWRGNQRSLVLVLDVNYLKLHFKCTDELEESCLCT